MMNRRFKRLPIVLFVIAGVCFGGAVHGWYKEHRAAQHHLVVLDPDRDLGNVALHVEIPVRFRISNPTAQDCMFLGMRESCGLRCCLSSTLREVTTIRAGSELELECVLKVELAGEFEAMMVLLLHDGKVWEQKVTVRGTGGP
jgi:hypothetical protein